MSAPVSKFVTVLLGAADAVKELVAAPETGSGLSVYIQAIHWSIAIAAAQRVAVGKAGGTAAETVLDFAASASGVGTRRFGGNGWKLTAETALSADPASAGPEISFIVEYNIAL